MSNNFFLADRIKETSRINSTGNILLDGAVTGFSSFGDFYASGDTVFYAITDNVDYEVGSGRYIPDGSSRAITRNVLRSSKLNAGPYYIYGSGAGNHAGQEGYFHPVWLTRSAAISGVGVNDGPFTGVHEHTFSGVPGVTFYMPSEHMGHAQSWHAGVSGSNYNDLSKPVDWTDAGLKEVFVTYPGKTSVFNGYGLVDGVNEPKKSGIAFWDNEQVLNYSSDIVWSNSESMLGIKQPQPSFAIDVGGSKGFSTVRASGFIEGGSGILFSGVAGSYSGGKQMEPFLRNQLGSSADDFMKLSGVVNQFIDFKAVTQHTVFVGPDEDCGCTDGVPSFRLLQPEDLPLSQLGNSFVEQDNNGLGADHDYPFNVGQIALYARSGDISYHSGILFDVTNSRLGVGSNDIGIISPQHTLDVSGNMAANSGYFDQLIFTNDLVRIGNSSGRGGDLLATKNYQIVSIGFSAGNNVSGVKDSFLAGGLAGRSLQNSSGVIVIGSQNADQATHLNQVVSIGSSGMATASGMTGVVSLGSNSLATAQTVENSVSIGEDSASGLIQSNNVVSIGRQSAIDASGLTDVVSIGQNAAQGNSGIYDSILVGQRAASGSYDLHSVAGFGNHAIGEAREVKNSIAIGKDSLKYAYNTSNVIAIGDNTARSGHLVKDSVAIGWRSLDNASGLYKTIGAGYYAASDTSGNFNVYIGNRAGAGVSGNKNIEIIASGLSESFLTSTANNKVNIGNIIAGDTSTSKVGIGALSDANPPATLFVRPNSENDAAFIIKHQASGSKTPYFMLQSGDGTTFFHITNSGDLKTSGCVEPSGGVCLPDKVPNMTSYRLYNDGGTLYWNGSQVDTAGSTTLKVANDTTDSTESDGNITSWTDGQLLTVSGVSGVEVQQVGRFLRVGASGLSGVLQSQITAQTYNFSTVASGYGSNNNLTKLQTGGSVVALSGISGVNIDFTNLDDGTNSSGVFTIGYDPSVTFDWRIRHANNGVNGTSYTVVNGDTVTVSGASGIAAHFDDSSKILRLGASGLSGVLDATIQNSGNYIWSDHTTWRASGIAVSGLAVSNYNSIQGITTKSATSGIILRDDKYVLDSGSYGHLSALVIKGLKPDGTANNNIVIHTGSGNDALLGFENSGVIAIGQSAGGEAKGHNNSIFLGNLAGSGSKINGDSNSTGHDVFIGYRAGYDAGGINTGHDSNVMIGSSAGESMLGEATVVIGEQAGMNASYSDHSIFIGKSAGAGCEYDYHSVYVGHEAGMNAGESSSDYNDRVVGIGISALKGSTDISSSMGIGIGALMYATGIDYTACLGFYAGRYSEDHLSSIFIGNRAGAYSKGTEADQAVYNIGIGTKALSYAWYCDRTIGIGDNAGYLAQSLDNSIFIGNSAGQRFGNDYNAGDGHLIISTKDTLNDSVVNPRWQLNSDDNPISDSDETFKGGLIDIATIIQGKSDNNSDLYLKIGKDLGDFSGTFSDTRKKEILKNNTLSIMSPKSSDVALKLCQNRVVNSSQGQNSSLLLAETYDGSLHRNNNYEVIDRNGHFKLQVYARAEWLRVQATIDVQESKVNEEVVYISEWQIRDVDNRIVTPEVGRIVMVQKVIRNTGGPFTSTGDDYVFVGARANNGNVVWKMLPWAL
jgi:hypothetical protein